MGMLNWLRRWRRRSADRQALMQMSARELGDIGIGRGEIGHLLGLGLDAARYSTTSAPDISATNRSTPMLPPDSVMPTR